MKSVFALLALLATSGGATLWFDRLLKGDLGPTQQEKPVRLFVMDTGDGSKDAEGRLRHGGRWMEADAWPLPEARATPFYLRGDGSLSSERPSS